MLNSFNFPRCFHVTQSHRQCTDFSLQDIVFVQPELSNLSSKLSLGFFFSNTGMMG